MVGLNSATKLTKSFWEYWSDTGGFNRGTFEVDYASIRNKRGVRPNIDQFVLGARPVCCLETNIYAVPSKRAKELRREDKDPSIFLYLLTRIRPRGIFVHSSEPIQFFEEEVKGSGFVGPAPVFAKVWGVETWLWGSAGPFYTKSRDAAASLGKQLARIVRADLGPDV